MTVAPDFEQLVDAHYTALYRFGLSLTRQESEAADLAQETFLLWAKKGSQLRDPAQAKTWLFTTLYREFLAGRRRDGHFPHADAEEAAAAELCAEPEPVPSRFDSSAVLTALNDLAPAYRAPVTLFYLRNFSYREIAEVLGIPAGTVMSRLARGKAELRRLLLAHEMQNATRIVPLPPTVAAGKRHE
jgi:RNA polymerase sigma factor (sigma-70 family)